MFCLADFEAHARQALDWNAWEFYSSGANHQQTLRDNEEAFSRYRFRPRVLRDVSNVDMRVELFGEWVEFPILVAPMGVHKMAHHEGELATAKACAKQGTCMTLSSWSTTSIEEVAAASGAAGLRWFQLYVYKDRELTRQLVERAERSGYKAIVLTVDIPVQGIRLTNARNKFRLPSHLSMANFAHESEYSSNLVKYVQQSKDPSQTWACIDWLCSITSLPIVLKGILTREDAVEALKHDIQGIVVSNHGGRHHDGLPATIDALSEVVSAVGGKVDVFLDGGVRQGSDVLKALAMGAKAVFIGRPVLWGLAYKGQEGVEQVLQFIKNEFKVAMQLSGCCRLSDIKPEMVVHETYYNMRRAKL